jgi:antibiotic biosynthesis monooxygenase (ABM) superfamily enzyme
MAEPIALLITHFVPEDRADDFLAHQEKIVDFGKEFEGYGGFVVFPPTEDQPRVYNVMVQFESMALLQEFWRSDKFTAWKEALDEIVEEQVEFHYTNGLEHWFPRDARPPQGDPPSTYKMAVVVFFAILPLVLVLPPLAANLLSGVHWFLGTLLTTAVMVLVMSYVAMPLMTRLFRPWLAAGP